MSPCLISGTALLTPALKPASQSPHLAKGSGTDFSSPTELLVPNWSLFNPGAAFDLKVIHSAGCGGEQ